MPDAFYWDLSQHGCTRHSCGHLWWSVILTSFIWEFLCRNEWSWTGRVYCSSCSILPSLSSSSAVWEVICITCVICRKISPFKIHTCTRMRAWAQAPTERFPVIFLLFHFEKADWISSKTCVCLQHYFDRWEHIISSFFSKTVSFFPI